MKTLFIWLLISGTVCILYTLAERLPPKPPPVPPPEWSIGFFVGKDGRVEMNRFFGAGPLPVVRINGVVAESRHYSTVQLDADSVVVITGN